MADEMKVMEVLNSEEGITLMAEYAKLYLQKYEPDLADNEDAVKLVILEIIKQYTNKSYPDGCDYSLRILTGLRSSIEDLKQAEPKPADEASPMPENIPLRPYSYSRYLDPEEVQWLVKYDPEVKAAADRFVKGFRETHPSSYDNIPLYAENLINGQLDLLYKLNRRDPAFVEEHNFTPSFLKQFDEGTPEEIVIHYFDTFNPKKEKKAVSPNNTKQDTKQNVAERRKNPAWRRSCKAAIWEVMLSLISWGAMLLLARITDPETLDVPFLFAALFLLCNVIVTAILSHKLKEADETELGAMGSLFAWGVTASLYSIYIAIKALVFYSKEIKKIESSNAR